MTEAVIENVEHKYHENEYATKSDLIIYGLNTKNDILNLERKVEKDILTLKIELIQKTDRDKYFLLSRLGGLIVAGVTILGFLMAYLK